MVMPFLGIRGRSICLVAVAALALVVFSPPSALADDDPTVSWVATGDSYSSGQGLPGDGGPCSWFDVPISADSPDSGAPNPAAYGPLARNTLARSGWTINEWAFSACTGHLAEDLVVRRSGQKGSLWEWAREQGVPDRVDIITLSFGGNDIGFADIVSNCLIIEADSWSTLVTGTATGLFNCDLSLDELKQRGNALLDPPVVGCTGGRGDDHIIEGEDRYNCDLWITDKDLYINDQGPQLRGSIADFYRYIVDEHLTDKGKLFVVGYPSLFAPTIEWSGWNLLACKGVTRGDADKLTAAAKELDRILKTAVERADGGEGRIVYLSNYNLYRAGAHELCGTGPDWLNGPAYDAPFDLKDSFHPNADGYQGTAQHLTTILRNIDWPSIELRSGGLGPVDFGSADQRAIDYVAAFVGNPDSDNEYLFVPLTDPWHNSVYGDYYAYGDNPDHAYRSFVTPFVREVCWRDELCLILGSDTGQEWVFVGWDYYVSEDDFNESRSKLGARTVEGISPGTTLGEIVERYPNIEVEQVETEEYELTLPGWERPSAAFYVGLDEFYDPPVGIPASYFDSSLPISRLKAGVQIFTNIG